ncbi:MAG: thiamine-binding protein, partial [candidate division Zixibacteria bacterium]|nr:thiamine-binding protein [candidate division Zixibacteria bacterium]
MLIQFSIFPTGNTGSTVCTDGADSSSGEVSKVIDIIDNSGLTYKTSSMSTVIEGEWDQIMPVINKCRLKLRENSNRV